MMLALINFILLNMVNMYLYIFRDSRPRVSSYSSIPYKEMKYLHETVCQTVHIHVQIMLFSMNNYHTVFKDKKMDLMVSPREIFIARRERRRRSGR